jgi:hypothetical protein
MARHRWPVVAMTSKGIVTSILSRTFRVRPFAGGMRHIGPRDPRNPRKPGRVAAYRGCPRHPDFRVPAAKRRCVGLCCGVPGGAHPAEKAAASAMKGCRHDYFPAALAALELGHLEPRSDELPGPPPSEALDQTTTAIWSDLFATSSTRPWSATSRNWAGAW